MTAHPLHAAASRIAPPEDVNARRQMAFVMDNVNATPQSVSTVEPRRLKKSLTTTMQQLLLKEVSNFYTS